MKNRGRKQKRLFKPKGVPLKPGNEMINVYSHALKYFLTNDTGVAQDYQGLVPDSTTGIGDERINVLCDEYRYYRLDTLRIKFWGYATTTNCIVSVLLGSVTSPNTLDKMITANVVKVKPQHQLTPAIINLRGSQLHGLLPWYMTEGVGDPEIESLGRVYIGAFQSNVLTLVPDEYVVLEIESEWTFRERLDSGVSAERKAARLRRVLPPTNDEKENFISLDTVSDNYISSDIKNFKDQVSSLTSVMKNAPSRSSSQCRKVG